MGGNIAIESQGPMASPPPPPAPEAEKPTVPGKHSQRIHPAFSEGSPNTSQGSSYTEPAEPTDPAPAPVKKIRVPDVFLKATKPAAMPVDVPAAAKQVVVVPKSARAAAAVGTSFSGQGSPGRIGGGRAGHYRHSSLPHSSQKLKIGVLSGKLEPGGPGRLQVARNGQRASSSERHRDATQQLGQDRDKEDRDGMKVLGIGGTGIVGGRGVSSAAVRRLNSPKVKLSKSVTSGFRGGSRTPRKYSGASPKRPSTFGADTASGVRRDRTLFEDRKARKRSASGSEVRRQQRVITQKLPAAVATVHTADTASAIYMDKAGQEFSDDDTSGNSEDYEGQYDDRDDGGASQISASQSVWQSVSVVSDATAAFHADRLSQDRAARMGVSKPGPAGGVARGMLARVGGGAGQRLASGDRAGGGNGLISTVARESRGSEGASATGGQGLGRGRGRSGSSYSNSDGHDVGSKGHSDKTSTPRSRSKNGGISVMIAGFGGALRSAVAGVSGGEGSGYSGGGRSSGNRKVGR